jgi:GT2 family glycosyltransferase
MNEGLRLASHGLVLFLDDDILPEPDLIAAHVKAHRQTGAAIVAGRVLQPWHESAGPGRKERFSFDSNCPAWIDTFMGCNFSIRKDVALRLGGFDENFVRVAYNFEDEFAYRLLHAGHRIYFEPEACIRHLRTADGGTRAFGQHLTTARPAPSVGAYYCILRTWSGWGSVSRLFGRPMRAVITRHHLRHPWWIPSTVMAEMGGLTWALVLAAKGPKLLALEATVSTVNPHD